MIKKVFGTHVLIKPKEAEEKTESGIYIPGAKGQKQQIGTVVAVGPGYIENGQRVPLDIVVGSTVIYNKYAGTEIVDGDTTYLIMYENEILAEVE